MSIYRLFFVSYCYCATLFLTVCAQDLKAPREATTNVICPSCPQQEQESVVSDCVCNELTVTGDAHITGDAHVHDDLVVTGTINAQDGITTSKIEASKIEVSKIETSTIKTSCGSSLDCNLFVENNATVANDLSVGGTITAGVLDVGTIVVSAIETSCGSSLGCDLFVENNGTITNDLSVGGTITSDLINATTISGSTLETTCGSSLDCDLLVHDSATITNELTVGCDVSVGCNILMHDSTDAAHGNIIKNGNRFMHNSGTNNTFLGQNSGTFTTTGSDNVGIGTQTLTALTSGTDNTGIGFQALTAITSGTQNTALGSKALANVLLGQDNTAVGYAALQNTTNEFECCTPSHPTALPPFCGPVCLYIGSSNTAVGSQALQNNLVGQNNVAVGSNALIASTTQFSTNECESLPPANATQAAGAGGGSTDFCTYSGNNNTALGTNSLSNVLIGSNNIAIGYSAGSNSTGGFNNIYVGNQGCVTSAQPSLTGFPTLSLGTDTNEHNVIRIGDNNVHTDTFIAAVYGKSMGSDTVLPIYINSNGELGTTLSSERFKEQIQSLDSKTILEKVAQLNAVSFFYKNKNNQENRKEQIGLIAEQVAEIFPELVVFDQDGKPLAVRYELLAVLCISALQSMERQQQDIMQYVHNLEKKYDEKLAMNNY